MFGSGTTTVIISNEEINEILKRIKPLVESGLWINGISESIENEKKEQKGKFLGMLKDILGASLLGNLFLGKGAIGVGETF